jgi:diguanylate cyclase (GGDEF)-like protein
VNKEILLGSVLLAGAAGWARLGRPETARAENHVGTMARPDEEPSAPVSPQADAPARRNGNHAAGLQYLVDHDQLTGLRNRHGFERVLGEALAVAHPGHGGALIKFGIDNFRYLNASRGRETCDLVLTSVASVVAAAAPEADMAARIGGDTFAIFLPDAGGDRVEAVARDVIDAVRTADLDVEQAGIRATMSAGITLLDRAGLTPGDVLLEADLAMARAKSDGRDRVAVYTRAELRPFKATRKWAEDIQEALESDSLELHCQPVRSLQTAHVQWELLVRLPQPDGQLLPPSSFLPTAERFGLVERVDAWVLERACDLIERQRLAGRRLDVEVNVSARSLTDRHFAELVRERLAGSALDPASLIFEVSEAVAVESLDDVRVFAEQLKDLGCRFALDNFGTTHASLVHLKHLPIDFVKIDGAFIRHLADDETDQQIVRAIIELAHGLGQRVIAAFVGDRETLELLERYGVDYVQGFEVGRPRPTAELE